jgi:GNAT superfamily N-acetyltransferase
LDRGAGRPPRQDGFVAVIYAGRARNKAEVERALDLAADVFHLKAEGDGFNARRFLTLEVPGVSSDDIFVVAKDSRVVGTIMLVDRRMISGGIVVPVTYITFVCIDPGLRGAGLSRQLMAAVMEECAARGSAMMMLIARRSVDGYYNKFGFWGLSSYSRVSISTPPLAGKLSLRAAGSDDVGLCGGLYDRTYGEELGRHERTAASWLYLLEKMRNLGISVLTSEAGYLIASANRVFELAVHPDADPTALLAAYGDHAGAARLELDLSPTHPLASELSKSAVRISRECSYGGHMGAVANLDILRGIVEQRIAARAVATRVGATTEEIDGIRYDWDGQKARVTVSGRARDFWTTSRLFGAMQLSTRGREGRLDLVRPFNILMADQV